MVRNEITGAAQLTGVVVQAGQIHGGIHHHAVAQGLPLSRQLPRVPPHFTAREDAAGTLSAARRGGTTLAVISGLPGVGKTALATRWLADAAAEGEAQLHADLGGSAGPVAPEVVLQQWLRALGLARTPSSLRELTGLWRSVTARRAVAVLLDNAADADQVRPLLPAGVTSMTVVTSRRLLWDLAADGSVFLPLGPLTPQAAIALPPRFAGEGRTSADPEAAFLLAERCAHLPLPLVLAGARLRAVEEARRTSVAAYVDTWGNA
ncbi:ATP-binding protein [Streptomyces sp. NRRL F-5527]|uniref:ATP-binding protein n=1 Tax=Streptomyces sp. NRRL F-5527 TaxID=1463862 RepID=UPI0004C5BE3A|nr:ATP-binding protein [Streptomyces sp. NRRL F-5527]